MADEAAQLELKKRRTFRKFTFRGVDLDQLLDMNHEQLMELFTCRIRRKFSRGMKVIRWLLSVLVSKFINILTKLLNYYV